MDKRINYPIVVVYKAVEALRKEFRRDLRIKYIFLTDEYVNIILQIYNSKKEEIELLVFYKRKYVDFKTVKSKIANAIIKTMRAFSHF